MYRRLSPRLNPPLQGVVGIDLRIGSMFAPRGISNEASSSSFTAYQGRLSFGATERWPLYILECTEIIWGELGKLKH